MGGARFAAPGVLARRGALAGWPPDGGIDPMEGFRGRQIGELSLEDFDLFGREVPVVELVEDVERHLFLAVEAGGRGRGIGEPEGCGGSVGGRTRGVCGEGGEDSEREGEGVGHFLPPFR